MRTLAIALLAALMAAPAAAQEKPVTLKKGAGLDLVEANCGACHSLGPVGGPPRPPEGSAYYSLWLAGSRVYPLTNVANMKHESLKGIAQNLRG